MSATVANNHFGAAGRIVKRRALHTVSASALLLSISALQAAQAQDTTPVEQVVVSGTRIQRDGYSQPTPVTVIGTEQIQAASPNNIADFVNQLPELAGSTTPQSSNPNISSGNAGINALNLRNLGLNRNLILVDGQRSVASTVTGVVDVSTVPQALVTRVDVVTGGASAAYGSDALSGVVNFILDKKYTGFKGDVSGGLTTYGDDGNWKGSLTYGTDFLGDQGHFLISGELNTKNGIYGVPRAWNVPGRYLIENPAYVAGNGQPERIHTTNAGASNLTAGGIITSTALRGTAFGPGGTPYQFQYGTQTLDPFTLGGDYLSSQINQQLALDPKEIRQGLFTRASFNVTDNVEVYLQGSWNYDHVVNSSSSQYAFGNITIQSSNPFIPASVAAQLAAQKITSFSFGKLFTDLPIRLSDNRRTVERWVGGADGHFSALDTDWTWNAYYQSGLSMNSENVASTTNNANFGNAVDAAINPTTGAIVCRSTIANPTNGCSPLDVFGTGVASTAAINYVEGIPHRIEDFHQDVMAASINGNPFSDWAGPVSFATGIEHRREAVNGFVPPIYNSGWFVGNFLVTKGSYQVTEGFFETVVPLLKDMSFTKSLDFNGAVRETGYSVSGLVTTWKVGATWQVIDDLRLRVTRSHDIRAPNLTELYQAGSALTNTQQDPLNHNAVTQSTSITVGNLGLVPEEADSLGLGIVLTPSFIDGFSASVDYYHIDISNAIGALTAQQIINNCYVSLQTQYCSAITRGTSSTGGAIFSKILIEPFNFTTQTAEGLDFEASYVSPLDTFISGAPGSLSARFLATNYMKNYTATGVAPPTDTAGSNGGNGPPSWRYTLALNYTSDPYSVTLIGRGVSAGTIDNSYVTCTTGCPLSTTNNITIDNNHVAGAFYLDLNASYKFTLAGADMQLFGNVKNLFNTDPASISFGPAAPASLGPEANSQLYDTLGRMYTGGIRFAL